MTPAFDPDVVRHHHERGARGAFFAMALQSLTGWPVATVEAWTDDAIDASKRPYQPVRFVNTDHKGRALDVTGIHEGATFLAGPALARARRTAFEQGAKRVMLGVRFFGPTLLVGADPVFKHPFGKLEAVRIENAKRQIRANKGYLAAAGRRRAHGIKDMHLPYYTHGSAYAYALALSRVKSGDTPLVSIEGIHGPSGQAWLHAGLSLGPGDLLDAWGAVSVEDVVRRYALTEVRVEEETYAQVLARFPDASSADRYADYIAQEASVLLDARPQAFTEHDGKKGFMQPLGGAFWRVVFERSAPDTPRFELGASSSQQAAMVQPLRDPPSPLADATAAA